jgi:pimeloyl-ACP methyl ester carboxylesterase
MLSLKYIERGKKNTVVLIPGWATDHRIFNSLDIKFNYLLPLKFSPFTFEKNLLTALREYRITKVSLFGWSLGGFWVAEFAAKYTYLIDEVILVSIRKRYQPQELTMIRLRLRENKEECLCRFYTQCFYKRNRLYWFRENLLKSYLQELDLNYLFTTLDYLEDKELTPEALKEVKKIEIIHGEFDRIAPIEEAMEIKRNLPQAKFIRLRRTGHIPFLETDFHDYGL